MFHSLVDGCDPDHGGFYIPAQTLIPGNVPSPRIVINFQGREKDALHDLIVH